MKKIIFTFIVLNLIFNLNTVNAQNSNKLYEKIDLFSEVLEKIKQE